MDDDHHDVADVADVAEVSEVATAARALSDADHLRLRAFGRWLLGGEILGVPPEGLVYEAIKRALDGKRKWRRDVVFVVFIKNAMRSIASELRDKQKVRAEDLEAGDPSDAGVIEGAVSEGPDPEAALIEKEEALLEKNFEEAILRLFDGKDNALMVVMGRLDGLDAADIRATCGLSEKDCDSASKAIRRARPQIEQILREVRKP